MFIYSNIIYYNIIWYYMGGDINKRDVKSNKCNVRNFYGRWWTIRELVALDIFWSYFVDSYKNQIGRLNSESIENVIKLADLYIKSGDKKLSVCAQQCEIKSKKWDIKNCQNQVLLQMFCREKELYLDRIDDAHMNFLESSAIDILSPTPKYLWNKQIIKEIKNGIMHKKAVSLPEWIYIYNPAWIDHPIDFRAIVRPDFVVSLFAELYFNINRCYVNKLDYWDVDFNRWFDDNVDKIYIEERVPTEDKVPISRSDLQWPNRDIIQQEFLHIYGISPFNISKQSKKRKLTTGEIKQLSEFFNNHVFGEAELKFCTLDKDSWYSFLIVFIGLAESYDLPYDEFINNREVRNKLLELEHITREEGWNGDIIADLNNKYSEFECIWLLPNYIELKHILISLIKDIFYEDKTLLDKNPEDRKVIVLKLVNDKLGQYISEYMSNEEYYRERRIEIEMRNIENEMINNLLDSGEFIAKNEADLDGDDIVIWCKFKEDWGIESYYCVKDEDAYYKKNKWWDMWELRKEAIERVWSVDVSEYKDEIHHRKDLPLEEKELYINMMKCDIMRIFDWIFRNINYQQVKLKMNIEWIWNYLKVLSIFNYYVNDLFLDSALDTGTISNRKHIRNAFSHNGCSVLPWVNKILFTLSGSEYMSWKPNRENIYDLQKLHNKCLNKNNNCLHQKNT